MKKYTIIIDEDQRALLVEGLADRTSSLRVGTEAEEVTLLIGMLQHMPADDADATHDFTS